MKRTRLRGLVLSLGVGAALAVCVPPTAHAGSKGPLAIATAKISQKKLRGKIELRVEGALPLGKLQHYPESLWAPSRHLCLALNGAGLRRRLFCVAGPGSDGRRRVSVSRYYRNGRARKLGSFWADSHRPSRSRLQLRFPLRRAGIEPGRLKYFAISSWRGRACADDTQGDRAGAARGHGRSQPRGECQDRWPNSGRRKVRIYPVQAVGCTTGREGVFTNGPRHRKRVALTFDDGPSSYTSQILHELDRLHAKGTFFQIGNQLGGHHALLRRIVKGGHELANHSYSHERYPSVTSMRATSAAIRAASGFRPCTFRPPYGLYNSGTVSAARDLGMSVALWDIDTDDYRQPGTDTIYSRAVQAGRGSIVLMHDGGGPRGQTVAALPRIVKKLRSRGYRLVTVTELLGGHMKLSEVR